jgi:CRP-like cAMP-binding protein
VSNPPIAANPQKPIDALDPLKDHPIFGEFAPGQIKQLAFYARQRRANTGAVIFRKGDPGNALYGIRSGTVKIAVASVDVRETAFNLLYPGDIFGEIALLDGHPRTADAFAADDCELMVIERRDFTASTNSAPKVAMKLIEILTARLRDISRRLEEMVRFYSCFISYSTKDQDFVERFHADLQNKGVRCWFAPHDLPIGGKILDEIDAAIRVTEKVVLILSEHSIRSDWVEDEVKAAFDEERKRGQTVLFPLRLDDAVMDTKEAWAAKLRADRNIGDFRHWKEHDAYQRSFDRAVRDLTAPPKEP